MCWGGSGGVYARSAYDRAARFRRSVAQIQVGVCEEAQCVAQPRQLPWVADV